MRERANRCCVEAKRLRLRRCASGKVVWQWDNTDPFGNNVPNENPSGQGTFNFNLRFRGQYYDKETGLAYNRFRDYDASAGRYIQSDLIGLYGGINTYGYVGGNPLGYADSLGLDYHTKQNGDTVTVSMTIGIYGTGATNELAQFWEKNINDTWNNGGNYYKSGKCKVKFNVSVGVRTFANYDKFDNVVNVMAGRTDASVDGRTYNTGDWGSAIPGNRAAHEAGHFMRLGDDYSRFWSFFFLMEVPDSGHEGHIMAESGGTPAQHEIDQIVNGGCGCN